MTISFLPGSGIVLEPICNCRFGEESQAALLPIMLTENIGTDVEERKIEDYEIVSLIHRCQEQSLF